MRFTLITFCLTFLVGLGSVRAQTTSAIRGRITAENGPPIADINVALQGTNRGAVSDSRGYYSIPNVKPGPYILVVSGVGFRTEKRSIEVQQGQSLQIDAVLDRSSQQLQEITVQGAKTNRYTQQSTNFVAKVPLKDINNPQVYNTVTRALLDDQLVTTLDDALKNVPGVYQLWQSTGRGGDGSGYYALRGFPTQPQMVNGLPTFTNGSPDPVNVERVEVIKGPSATLFGNTTTSYGGLINVVTKSPYETTGGEISYQTGSFGKNRVTADVNAPLQDNMYFRITSAYDRRGTFQNAGFSESFFIAPSLRYEPSDRLSFTIRTELYRSEKTNPTMLFLSRTEPLDFTNTDEFPYNPDLSYTSNDITLSNPTFNLQGQMHYELSDDWSSQTVISSSVAETKGYYSYIIVAPSPAPSNAFNRLVSDQNSTTNGIDIQQNFRGEVRTGSIGHKMLLGADFLQRRVTNNSTGYVIYDSFNITNPNPAGISRQRVDSLLTGTPVNTGETQQQVWSAYASDVVQLLPQLSVMASLRLDHFDNDGSLRTDTDDFEQTTLSPKFGVMIQPLPEVLSIFGNYQNSFNNVAPVMQDDGTIATFGPERANQWEGGLKANLMDGRMSLSASYYDITVSDIVRADPVNPQRSIQDGEVNSRGVEFSLTATPVEGLNVIAGYSHNISEFVRSATPVFDGRRPERAGPSDLVNLWVSYEQTNGLLRGLGVGVGGNYASDHYPLNRNNTGRFTIPAYTVLNGSIFYNTDQYRLTLKADNFADEEYYSGWSTVSPQPPRAFTAGFTYKF